MLNGSLPETSSNSNVTQRNSINQEIGAQSAPPHNKGKPTVESDVENKIQASQNNDTDTINETVLSSRQITECDQKNYKSLIDTKIVAKPLRYSPVPSYILEDTDGINFSEANKITVKLGYENVKDFLSYITSEEFFNTASIELLLEYKESLLKIIQCDSLKGESIICGFYYALRQILDKLRDTTVITECLKNIELNTSNSPFLVKYFGMSFGNKAGDFQHSVSDIHINQTIENEFLRKQAYNTLQGKPFLYSDNDVHPPTFIASCIINKFHMYIKNNDYIITNIDSFNKIIRNVTSSIFFVTNNNSRMISATIDALLNPANKKFLKKIKDTSMLTIYEEITEQLNKMEKNFILPYCNFSDIISKYTLNMSARELGTILYTNKAGLLFTNLGKKELYSCLYFLDALVEKRTSIQQQEAISNIQHSQCIASDTFMSKLEDIMFTLDKMSKIDSLEKFSSSDLENVNYIKLNYLKKEDIIFFIQAQFVNKAPFYNICKVYCDIVKLDRVIQGSFYKALLDRDNINILLTEHIPFFKYIAEFECSEYKGEAWMVAGDITAYCLRNAGYRIKKKAILQDAMDFYLNAATAGKHEGYYKIAELILGSFKGDTLKTIREALEYYKKALDMVSYDDQEYIIFYSANIELLKAEVDKTLQAQQIIKTEKQPKPKKSAKQTNISKQAKINSVANTDISLQQQIPITSSLQEATASASINIDAVNSACDTVKIKSATTIQYTLENRIKFWNDLKLVNKYLKEHELGQAKIYLDGIIDNPFSKQAEIWIQAMVIQNKVFFYYTMLQVSLVNNIEFYFLDSDIKKTTPTQITEDILIQKSCNLILLGLKHLGVDQSDVRLLKEDIDVFGLPISERKQTASLLSMRAHIYSYQSIKAKGSKKTKFIDNYKTLYNKADMVNPARLLRTHEYS
jgi:hypothetical protein